MKTSGWEVIHGGILTVSVLQLVHGQFRAWHSYFPFQHCGCVLLCKVSVNKNSGKSGFIFMKSENKKCWKVFDGNQCFNCQIVLLVENKRNTISKVGKSKT